jgi:hypothetical protein
MRARVIYINIAPILHVADYFLLVPGPKKNINCISFPDIICEY